jgi:alanyl-tRNA synthetase
MVSVYTVGQDNKIFSAEICTGPHAQNTADLSPLKITKQESAGSGKRRLYAVFG